MSKASEWAKIQQEQVHNVPKLVLRDVKQDYVIARVCNQQDMAGKSRGLECEFLREGSNSYRMWITPKEALTLAHWILEIFGERDA